MEIVNSLPDARDSLSINIKLFSLIGLWFSQKNPTLRKIYPYYCAVIIGIFYTSFIVSQIIYMIVVWGDIEEMVGVLFLMVTIIGEYFKMYPLIVTPERINNLLKDLENPRFQPKNKNQEDILRNGMKTARMNSVFFIVSCFIVASFWGLYPILDGSYKEYKLPMATWMPFDITASNVYPCVYAYTYCGVMMSAFVNAAYDTFITGIMIHVAIQLDILSDSLANIKIKYDIANLKLEEEFMGKIINCVKQHTDILRFAAEMENVFSSGVMAEFCAAGFVLVVTLFQITLVSPISFQFIMLASYFSCIMYQLFVYCWFGNEVTLKSSNVLEAAYKCDWHVCGYKKYRRILLLLMVRLQRPIVVKAGNFIPLSIETFMTIVKSSWSYFNLLRQVNIEEIAE